MALRKRRKPLWAQIMDWLKPDSAHREARVRYNNEAKAKQRARDAAKKAARDASYRKIGVNPDED
jgi:hypothetical protein